MRAEVNETETEDTIEKIEETKGWLLWKNNQKLTNL